MRQTLATLATLACARAWPALDEALAAYPRARVHRRVQAPERVLAPPRRLRVDAHRPQHAEGSSGKAPGREMN